MSLLPSLATESSTDWWITASELALVVSSVVLALGIVGEMPESASWKLGLLYKAAKWLVFLGVVGELIGDGGIFVASARLQTLQQISIANAQTDASRANALAARLESEAAPRDLHALGTFDLGFLARGRGEAVEVTSYAFDAEGGRLAAQVVRELTRAGVPVEDNSLSQSIGKPLGFGVYVSGPDADLVAKLIAWLSENRLQPIEGTMPTGAVALDTETFSLAPAATISVAAKPLTVVR